MFAKMLLNAKEICVELQLWIFRSPAHQSRHNEQEKKYYNISRGNFTNYRYTIFDGRELVLETRSLFLTLEMINFHSQVEIEKESRGSLPWSS
jgi:hypothetical protein